MRLDSGLESQNREGRPDFAAHLRGRVGIRLHGQPLHTTPSCATGPWPGRSAVDSVQWIGDRNGAGIGGPEA